MGYNMKNSDHYYEKSRKKAIKEAQQGEETSSNPEDLIENSHFKKQYDAEYIEKLPHKEGKHKKKLAKRSSTKDTKEPTEPDHIHYQNERWSSVTTVKSNEKRNRMNHKDGKYKK